MINCQLGDQIESPTDFSHFDPICLAAVAPPIWLAAEHRRTEVQRSAQRPAPAAAISSKEEAERRQWRRVGGSGDGGECRRDGRDFRCRRRLPSRFPTTSAPSVSHSNPPRSSPRPPPPPPPPPPPLPARPPSSNHIPTDLRRWNSQLQSLQDSAEGQNGFFPPELYTPRGLTQLSRSE